MIDLSRYQVIGFFCLIVGLYLVSRRTTNALFIFLRRVLTGEKKVFVVVSLLYLPGTILHEFAHFLMATVLMLRVREVRILPEWEKNYIRLGRVLYEKKDFVRGILVGVAPILAGVGFFWWLALLHLFPLPQWWMTLMMGYVIYTVSSTMFSSKQDLIDLIYIVPVVLLVFGIIYILGIDLGGLVTRERWQIIEQVTAQINGYLLLSVVINAALWLIFTSLAKPRR
ncbi:hypothetical protein M1523_02545 [Patescibacteria group bacterium]|nr:hypothetical protein [Patescibacteria group bacterium]MCL5091400.1 hypothetical protein [Patescibacteria group bacterium]